MGPRRSREDIVEELMALRDACHKQSDEIIKLKQVARENAERKEENKKLKELIIKINLERL